MFEIGVLEKLDHCSNSPWIAPLFLESMKTVNLRVLTDMREVNKLVKRKFFHLPRIKSSIHKIEKFNSATAPDFTQG